MSTFEWLAPVFALLLLTFGLLFRMGFLRYRATTTRAVRVKDIALGQSAWPTAILKVDRAFHNQLELPLLFYLLITLVLVTHSGDRFMYILAWLFVALRYAHAFVHTTTNVVLHRFLIFIGATLTLMLMWIAFAIRIAWVS